MPPPTLPPRQVPPTLSIFELVAPLSYRARWPRRWGGWNGSGGSQVSMVQKFCVCVWSMEDGLDIGWFGNLEPDHHHQTNLYSWKLCRPIKIWGKIMDNACIKLFSSSLIT